MKNICEWDKCKKVGEYKAPAERDNSKNYKLYCLEHIKIFNKNWNYFSEMSGDQIEYFIKSDLDRRASPLAFTCPACCMAPP